MQQAAGQGQDDQRKNERIDFEIAIDVQSDDNFFAGITMNISSGGLFIATDRPLPVGQVIRIRFTVLTLHEQVESRAVVRWVRGPDAGDRDLPTGMGVQFLDLPPHVVQAVDAFIRDRRQAIFFDR